MNTEQILLDLYPEKAVGGFTRVDGTIQFYQRVNALIGPNDVLLDLGAGRGVAHQDREGSYKTKLMNFRGRCGRVIGIDIDPAVYSNPSLDEARLIEDSGIFPCDDNSVDLVLSDYTFEHVEDPTIFSREISRVLKPGGWLCARTPNKFGYISLGANLIPNSQHKNLLRVLQPNRKELDVFPTRYRLNSRRDLSKHFPDKEWNHFTYTWNAEPAYFGSSKAVWRAAICIFALLPPSLRATLMIFSQKV